MLKKRESQDYAYCYKENLKQESKLLIIRLFKTLFMNETIIESERKLLKNNLSSKESFLLLQQENGGMFLNRNNFKWFLEDMGSYLNDLEIEVLFRRFDKYKEERVSFSQVCHYFLFLNSFIRKLNR